MSTQKTNEDIPFTKRELLECIQNLMGSFDNPVTKMKLNNSFTQESLEIGRNILKKCVLDDDEQQKELY